MRGRKPKPTFLKLITGNPGKRELNLDEPVPAGALLEAPATLSPRAREIWDESLRHAPAGMLTPLDGAALETFCRSKALVEDASRLIDLAGGANAPGHYFGILNRQTQSMMRAIVELGFSPVSRTRVKTQGGKKTPGKFSKLKDQPIDDKPKR